MMKSLQRQQKQCGVLIDEAEKKEKQALNQWQTQKQQVINAQEQLQQLKAYSKGQPHTGTVTPQQLVNRSYFSQQLIQVIHTQEKAIEQLKGQSDRAHQIYLQSQVKRKALEKYQEKLEKKVEDLNRVREQKALDEWVSNKYSFK